MKALYWEGNIEEWYLGHQFEEIFKSRVYDPFFVGKKDLTVLDIGANLGVFTLYVSPFVKRVYAIEPTGETFECLQKTVSDMTNVTPLHLAISNNDGESPFYLRPHNKTMNSLSPDQPNFPHETIQTMRLDTFFKKMKIDHVDFMKLDVEGSEYDIICGDGFGNISDKVDTVMGEIHTWANRNPNQLKEAFVNRGFKFEWMPRDATLFVAHK